MKKLLSLLLVTIILSCSLTGCKKSEQVQTLQSETTLSDNTRKTEVIETGEKLEIQMTVYISGYKTDIESKVFDNSKEFEKFVTDTFGSNYSEPNVNSFYLYDENFFKDKVLFYTSFYESTTSVEVFTQDAYAIKKDGKVTITVPSFCPAIVDCRSGYYCVFVEINKSDISDLASYDDILFYEERTNEEYKE